MSVVLYSLSSTALMPKYTFYLSIGSPQLWFLPKENFVYCVTKKITFSSIVIAFSSNLPPTRTLCDSSHSLLYPLFPHLSLISKRGNKLIRLSIICITLYHSGQNTSTWRHIGEFLLKHKLYRGTSTRHRR